MKRCMTRVLCLLMIVSMLLPMAPRVEASGYDKGYTGGMAGDDAGILARGVDISTWQGHDVDFKKIKSAGYSFVILRAGFATTKDDTFEENYTRAKAAGLDVGVYLYSYADNVEEARGEAAALKTWLSGKTLEYPVYYDLEEPTIHAPMSVETLSDIAMAFMDVMAEDGWLTGLYSCKSWLDAKLDTARLCARYECWMALYLSSGTSDKYDTYDGYCGMWQFSCSGSVDGIPGDVDMNVCFKDYPTICKKYGFNGYAATGETMILTGATFFPVLFYGTHMDITGRVTSTSGKLTSLTVGFYDERGQQVKAKTVEPKETTYELSNLDSAIKTQELAEGRYEYRITAVNGFERLVLYRQSVVVSRQGIRADDLTAPEELREGDDFRIGGKITSLTEITSVTLTVKQKNTPVLKAEATPGETTFDLLALVQEMKFNTLPMGEYTYTVEAATDKGKTTFLSQAFRVWVRSDPIVVTDLSLKTDYYPGDEIAITGTVTSSKSNLTDFVLEILDSKGETVAAAQAPTAARVIPLEPLSEKLDLSNLSIGIYTCRITAQNDAGPKTVVERNFFVRPDGVSLCQAVLPTRLVEGETFLFAGVLASDVTKLEFVSVTVSDPNGLVVFSDAAIPTGNSFDLAAFNDDLMLSRLPANDYTLRITAKNGHFDGAIYEKPLSIVESGDLIRWSEDYFDPTGLAYCSTATPGFWGELSSDTSPITDVTVSIVTAEEGRTMSVARLTPNRKTVQLDTLNEKLRFPALGVGSYRFVVTATNAMGTYEMLNAPFEVTNCMHTHVSTGNIYGASCTAEGAICDSRCLDCGEKIRCGSRVKCVDHVYRNGVCSTCGRAKFLTVTTQETKIIPENNGRIVIAAGENGKWYALGSDGAAVAIDAPDAAGKITVSAELLWTPEFQRDGSLILRNAYGKLLHFDSRVIAGRGVANTALQFSTNGLKMELCSARETPLWLCLNGGTFTLSEEQTFVAVFTYLPSEN